MPRAQPKPRPLFWMGSSRRDLKRFPPEVQDEMGYALRDAQFGGKRINAKSMRGFGGAGVVEIVEDFDRKTHRAVYTAKLEGAVYVLHAFEKKAKHGIATPRTDVDLVGTRLQAAREHHRRWRST